MTADFGHVGVYIGNNQVIECTLGSRGDGVVQTDFAKGGWAYWCQCPCITDDTGKSTPPTSTVTTGNVIYKSLGTAAKRKGASTSAVQDSCCVKGKYYPASQLVTPAAGTQQWFRHAGTDLYSALTDTPAGGNAKLFEKYGTYTEGKVNAIANVRAAAGLNGSKLTQLKAGDTVYVVDKATSVADGLTWVQIVYNGDLAWVDRQWVDF